MPVTLAEPIVRGPLALFPVLDTSAPAPEYLTGPAADAAELLAIDELGEGAEVPELLVRNMATVPVLLLEGETVVGAKQNRTLNVTILVPPASALPVPVSCVEAGRWGSPRATKRSGRFTPPDLRRLKNEAVNARRAAGATPRADQGAVWDRVHAYNLSFQTESPTDDFEAVHNRVEGDAHSLLEGVMPIEGQRGVLVQVAGQVRGLDLFDKAETLAAYWDGLLAGYVVDAIVVEPHPPDARAASQFLERVQSAERTVVDAVGSGTARLLNAEGVEGHELMWDQAAVHLAAFPTAN